MSKLSAALAAAAFTCAPTQTSIDAPAEGIGRST
jgi:hypothetical protein